MKNFLHLSQINQHKLMCFKRSSSCVQGKRLAWDRIHNTSFFCIFNGPNKLECYITLIWKGFPGKNTSLLGPSIICEENEVL
jgi:hypothetical protein